MKKMCFFLFMFLSLFIIGGCSASKTSSFQATVEAVNNEEVLVNCSDVVIKEKKNKNVNALGYICKAKLKKDSAIVDKNHDEMNPAELVLGQKVKITLEKPQAIGKKAESREFSVSKIEVLSD